MVNMSHKILAINPGSTSTKIALYVDDELQWSESVNHSVEELSQNETISKQQTLRQKQIVDTLKNKGVTPESLSAVVGRGGLLPPVKSGGYAVNQAMIDFLKEDEITFHASNLGALIACSIAEPVGIPSYIYDAVTSDEMCELAHITGMPDVYRKPSCHVLNSKAMCRKYAKSVGKKYEEMNFLVSHLGGGVTASAHQKGKIIDSLSDDDGAFAPERSGAIPIRSIIEICYSGKYTKNEMLKKQRGMGGLKAILGEHDCQKIEQKIANGDKEAKLAYEAFAYQIAKGIGLLSPVLKGDCDAVILTGGIAHSKMLTDMVEPYVSFIGKVVVLPGENELESLALGALRILKGEEIVHEFQK